MNGKWQAWRRDQSGGTAALTAILLIPIIGVIGLVVDMGHYYTVNQQLKNAADAGALAGVRAIYPYDLSTLTNTFSPNCTMAVNIGRETTQVNKNDNENVVVSDIQAGRYDFKTRQFTALCTSDPTCQTNAVKVTTRRENCPLYFMQVLGFRPYTLQATSIAVMDWAGSINPGHPGLGLAVGQKYVDTSDPLKIFLNDDSSDTGCWYTTPPGQPSDSLIMNFLEGKLTTSAPVASLGNQVFLNNGVFTNVVHELGGPLVGAEFTIPVVDTVKFNQDATVVGLRTVSVVEAGQDKGKKYVSVRIKQTVKEAGSPAVNPGGNRNNSLVLAGARLVQ